MIRLVQAFAIFLFMGRLATAAEIGARPDNLSPTARLFEAYGCTGCHGIPGITGPEAKSGGSLSHIRLRRYIGGTSNNIENLTRWIKSPKAVYPQAEMPETGISEQDARSLAEYLYSN